MQREILIGAGRGNDEARRVTSLREGDVESDVSLVHLKATKVYLAHEVIEQSTDRVWRQENRDSFLGELCRGCGKLVLDLDMALLERCQLFCGRR